MCSADLWWWLNFVAIVVSGAFGGVARLCWDMSDSEVKPPHFMVYIITGIAAAFLVPLFLNTISSSLIDDTSKNSNKLFLLIGFCIAAGAFAKQFVSSVGIRALKLSKQANAVASEAKSTADRANIVAKKADNRAVALFHVLKLVEAEKFQAALAELDIVIGADSASAEAWAWRGYCLKRVGSYSEAVSSMERALREEGSDVFAWVYNLACYKCLASASCSEVVSVLERAWLAAQPTQRKTFERDLQGDEDFARILTSTELSAFLERVRSSP